MRLPDDDRDLYELREALECGDHRGLGPPQAMELVLELLLRRAQLRVLRGVAEAAVRARTTTLSPVVIQVDPEAFARLEASLSTTLTAHDAFTEIINAANEEADALLCGQTVTRTA